MNLKRFFGLALLWGFVAIVLGFSSFSINGYVIGSLVDFRYEILLGLILLGGSLILLISRNSLEVIVVPTGPSLEADKQRALKGAERFHKRESRYVIISGQYNDGVYSGSQPEKIYHELVNAGVPKDKIIFENKSSDTMENVLYTCDTINDLAKEKELSGPYKVIVCTDKPHAKRFRMLLKRAKKEGYAPGDLRIRTDSRGINPSYSSEKAKITYIKDKYRPMKK
jgi:uncharacterized SAM-binding protein YcdF (DUF218 family)